MKIFLKIFLALFFPFFALAGLVTLQSGASISVAGIELNISGSDASLNTLTVRASNFDVTLDAGDIITITSSSRRTFTVTQSGSVTSSATCSASASTLTVKNPAGAAQATVTITPDAATCDSGTTTTTTTSSSSGGGGIITGGGGLTAPTGPTTTPSTATTTPPAQTPTVVGALPPPGWIGAAPIFTRDLASGSTGDDVTQLQTFLASDKSIYPDGLITGYFGSLTREAVRRFQAKYGISQVGRVGPLTRVKLAEIFGAGQPPAAVSTPASPLAVGLTRELDPGMTGDDVKALQEFLAQDKALYPEGLATGYYGPATTRAVKRLQAQYGISQVGRVGPQTLKKLQELMGPR